MKKLILMFSLLVFSTFSFAEIDICDTDRDGIVSGSEQYLCTNQEIPIQKNSQKVKQEPLHENETQAISITSSANKKNKINDEKTTVIDQKTQKSEAEFKQNHPCPVGNKNKKSCAGYIITYITPLECGGQDVSTNMQWQIILPAEQIKKRQHDQCEELAKAITNIRTVTPKIPVTSRSPSLDNEISQNQENYNDVTQSQIQDSNKKSHFSGFVFITGLIIFVIAGLWFTVIAFQTSVLWGLLCLFGPGIMSLIFTVLYWDISKKPFYISVISIVIMICGFL